MCVCYQNFLVCSQVPDHIGISTDGYGCCVTIGGGRRGRPTPDDNAGEGTSYTVPLKRKRSVGRKRRKEEKKDISARKKHQFPLQKITPANLSTIMYGSNLIGVDPGLKSLVTAVRSNNPADNVQMTAGIKMA